MTRIYTIRGLFRPHLKEEDPEVLSTLIVRDTFQRYYIDDLMTGYSGSAGNYFVHKKDEGKRFWFSKEEALKGFAKICEAKAIEFRKHLERTEAAQAWAESTLKKEN